MFREKYPLWVDISTLSLGSKILSSISPPPDTFELLVSLTASASRLKVLEYSLLILPSLRVSLENTKFVRALLSSSFLAFK